MAVKRFYECYFELVAEWVIPQWTIRKTIDIPNNSNTRVRVSTRYLFDCIQNVIDHSTVIAIRWEANNTNYNMSKLNAACVQVERYIISNSGSSKSVNTVHCILSLT